MQSTLLSFIMTNVFDSNTNIVNDKNNPADLSLKQ